jgi:lipoprotein-anchoring transpeptidase ErfK/SrfK
MSQQPQQHRGDRPNAIAGFIDRYGWRAYALPVLALLTVVGLFRANDGHGRAEAVGEHNGAPASSVAAAGTATPSNTAVPSNTAGPSSSRRATAASTSASAKPTRVRKVSLAPDPGRPGKQSTAQSPAAAATPCKTNTSTRKVVVSIGAQHAWMCAGKSLAYSSAVTTGKSGGHATPSGTFKVQGNVTGTTLRGSDYAVHVDYWIQFNGDIGFHDASWQTMPFGSSGYTSQGSRGCVHMPLKTVAWLHKWVQIGKTVVVVTKS